MSVCLSVRAIRCSIFLGLSLALRSHDQIPGLSLVKKNVLNSTKKNIYIYYPTPIFGGMWRRPLQWKERSSSQGTDVHTHTRTLRLYDWIGPVGRFSENLRDAPMPKWSELGGWNYDILIPPLAVNPKTKLITVQFLERESLWKIFAWWLFTGYPT